MKKLRLGMLSASSLLLAGCQLAPDYQRPELALPGALGDSSQIATTDASFSLDEWWVIFNDPQLTYWVERALGDNLDAQIAASRVIEARARMGFNRADRWPVLSGQANFARQDPSDRLTAPGAQGPQSTFQVAALLDFELDVWGRLANRSRSASEAFLSSTYHYATVRTTLIADVATTYFSLRAAYQQLAIALETVKSRRDTLELQDIRYEGGFITELERQQAAAELAGAEVEVPTIRQTIAELESSLLILAGAEPEEFWDKKELQNIAGTLPAPPPVPLDEIPVSLLARRPDILAAEADARAATFDIGAVRAERWPRITLSGLVGAASNPFGNLFGGDTRTWSASGNLLGTLYDFGRTASRVEESEAVQEQRLLRYRLVVTEAFREVSDAITLLQASTDRMTARTAQKDALDKAVALADTRYNEGYSSYLDLLDAQRIQFEAELALVIAHRDRMTATINICKALGGGWSEDQLLAEFDAIEVRADEEG